MLETTFGAKLLTWIVGLVPALLGSAMSMTMPSEVPKPANWKDYMRMVATFISGVIIAQISGNFIMEHWPEIKPDSATIFIIKFAIGLYGMRGATAFYIQIPDWVSSAKNKFLGN